jgi:Fe2+ or Zn2+ uptake regulation protein
LKLAVSEVKDQVVSHYKRDYVDEIHAKGYRVTPQRLAILDAVCDIGRHATIGEIQFHLKQSDPSIDLATIYRNLKILCEVGLLVSAHTTNQGDVYEIAHETPHQHLICKRCGQMQSVESTAFLELQAAIQRDTGFAIEVEHLMLRGVCKNCSQEDLITDAVQK